MSRHADYFSEEVLSRDLKGKTVRGGVITAASQAIQLVSQIATIAILARLLTKADFGLVTMATIFTGFAALFVDAGLSMATLQRPKITHGQVTNLFWVAAGLGCLMAGMVAALSPAVAWFYSDPRLTLITLALCPSFVLAGFTIQHQALLQRSMQYRALATVRVAAVLIGQLSAILVAAWTHSYWALVLMPNASALVRLLGTWYQSGWWPGLPRRGTQVWRMLTFGGHLTASSVTLYISNYVDKLLLGYSLGEATLGAYERSWRLLVFPLRQLSYPLAGVMIPALSRLHDRPQAYRRAYERATMLIVACVLPLIVLSLVAPDWLILTVLGDQWTESINIYWILCLGLPGLPIASSTGWLFVSQGRGREVFCVQLADCTLTIVLTAIGLQWEVLGVAAAVTARLYLSQVVVFTMAGRIGPVGRTVLWKMYSTAIAVSCLGAAATLAVRWLMPSDIAPWKGLLLITPAALVSCISLLACIPSSRQLLLELFAARSHLFTREAPHA